MVQLKYFGDSRDYFKYDLITWILDEMGADTYVFVPMLTNHRTDREGNKRPKPIGGKSASLLSFIGGCPSASLCHWKTWLAPQHVDNYKTVEPVDAMFFTDGMRVHYWAAFAEYLRERNALIFLDPDTGIQSGDRTYLRKMGAEKYILDCEIALLHEYLNPSSVLMIYQHLPRNKCEHEKAVQKKLKQLDAQNGNSFICGYREDDLAFLFMSKQEKLFTRLRGILERYRAKSEHKNKSLHLASKLCG
jgi:hypothetical protein